MLADRVKETSTTTGTGTLNLDGALVGYRSFVAGIGTGKSCTYCIEHQAAPEWEVGIGLVSDANPDTLSRQWVQASSNGGALVNFSAGTKNVFVPLSAAAAMGLGEINVKEYGAKGDGATDDTVAIQAALDAVSSVGGIVYFPEPPAWYKISSALNVAKARTTIIGANKQVGIRQVTNTANMFNIAKDYVQIRNLWFGADTAPGGYTSGKLINISDASEVLMEDLWLGYATTGISITGTSAVIHANRLVLNTITASTGVGININTPGNDFYFHNIVMDTAGSNPWAGIRLSDGGALFLTDSDFMHCQYGLVLDPASGSRASYNFIMNTAFDTCGINGIYVIPSGTGKIEGNTFLNIWATNAQQDGVVVQGGVSQPDGLRFIGLRAHNNGRNGFISNGSINLAVGDSDFAGNSLGASGTYHGITIGAGVSKFQLTNNRSGQSSGFGNTQGYGIMVASGTSNNYIITSNHLIGNITAGLSDGGSGSTKAVANNIG